MKLRVSEKKKWKRKWKVFFFISLKKNSFPTSSSSYGFIAWQYHDIKVASKWMLFNMHSARFSRHMKGDAVFFYYAYWLHELKYLWLRSFFEFGMKGNFSSFFDVIKMCFFLLFAHPTKVNSKCIEICGINRKRSNQSWMKLK